MNTAPAVDSVDPCSRRPSKPAKHPKARASPRFPSRSWPAATGPKPKLDHYHDLLEAR